MSANTPQNALDNQFSHGHGVEQELAQQTDCEQQAALLLPSIGAVADRAMVLQARRRVRERAMEMATQRRRARQAVGLAILGFSLLLLVLTPVLWGGVRMEEGWQHFADSEMQTVYVVGWLFPATIAGLVIGLMRARSSRTGGRRLGSVDSPVR